MTPAGVLALTGASTLVASLLIDDVWLLVAAVAYLVAAAVTWWRHTFPPARIRTTGQPGRPVSGPESQDPR